MEGATIHFFNSLMNDEEDLTWEQLKQALLERYGGHGDGDVYEQLTELKQTGNVDDYITEFEYLTAQIPRLPDKQFLGYFLHGLKEEVRGRARSLAVLSDLSRGKLLQVARAVEKETRRNGSGYTQSTRSGHGSNRVGSYGPNKGGNADWVLVKGGKEATRRGSGSGPRNDGPGQHNRRSEHRDRGFTHLSYNELMERKKLGLCFKCKGPYSKTHQCPDKHLRVLIVDDDEEGEEEGRLLAVEVEEGEGESEGEMCIMSLLQLGQLGKLGSAKPQSIQLKGTVGGVPVVILVDSGATHNFVDRRLVQKMSWAVDNSTSMCIKLGDGTKVQSVGVCPDLNLEVGEVQLAIRAHLFDLGGVDIVLGVDWLRTLGDIIMNWSKHTMSFWHDKVWVTLQGLNDDMKTLNSIVGSTNRGGISGLRSIEKKRGDENDLNIGQQQVLEGLLSKYEDIFK
jgi:hypothetical protein